MNRINRDLADINVINHEHINEDLTNEINGNIYFNPFKLHNLYIKLGYYKDSNDNMMNLIFNRLTNKDFDYFMKTYMNIEVTDLD